MAKKKLPSKVRKKGTWKRRSKPGDAPGQILVDPNAVPTRIHVIGIGGSEVIERELHDVHELQGHSSKLPRSGSMW